MELSGHTDASPADWTREEERDWRDMPFCRLEDGKIVDHWAPIEINGASEDHVYEAKCAIGMDYALRLIDHMRTHAEHFDEEWLSPIFQDMMKRGKWEGVECGFVSALGEYIAWGRVNMAYGFKAVPPDLERPAAEA